MGILSTYQNAYRLLSHEVRMYLFSSALVGISYFGITAVLLNLYLLRLGYGPEFIGAVNGSTAVAFAVSSLPSGALGARLGIRKMMLLGIGCLAAGVLFLPLAELLPGGWQAGGIVVTRLFGGLGFALYMVNANPFMTAATSPEERDHAFSMQVAMMPLAGFIGSLAGGVMPAFFASMLGVSLEHVAPYRYPLIIAGVFVIAAVAAVMTTEDVEVEDLRRYPGTVAAPAPWTLIVILCIVALFRMSGESAARSFFNVYLDDGLGVATATIGILMATSQIFSGSAALSTPLLVKRLGRTKSVALGTGGIASGLLVMALIPHWIFAGLGFIWAITMLSVTREVVNVYQMEIVPPGWRATVSGATSMAMGTGYSSMAFGGGYLITSFGYQGTFLTGAILTTISASVFWIYFRKPRGEYARQPSVDIPPI